LFLFRREKKHILYCDDIFDLTLFETIKDHLSDIEIVAKTTAMKKKIEDMGHKNVATYPAFPDTVIMFRNKAWRFPCKKIIKIGLKHGAYNFKKHSNARYYNMFDMFFLTSQQEIKNVRDIGVTIPLYAEYPKIDELFDGTIDEQVLKGLSQSLRFDPSKKTLLFSATYDDSGMSAIDRWYDRLSEISEKYNILVTVHEWTSKKYTKVLLQNPDIHFIQELSRLKYIKLADICIVDNSSIIAEMCLVDKPMIAFRTEQVARLPQTITDTIDTVSIRIDDFAEIGSAVDTYLKNPTLYASQRKQATKIFFDTPDGYAGKRIADRIIEMVPSLRKE
jgi:uncharacterized pyridoxamine 5'-phosphate oxidase family protein